MRNKIVNSIVAAVIIMIPVAMGCYQSWHQEPMELINYSDYIIICEEKDIEEQVLGCDPCTDFFQAFYPPPEDVVIENLDLMARCVEAEAGNQSMLGKRMVVDVILNRVDDSDFPDSVAAVITQKNAFTSYWDGRMTNIQPSQDTYDAIAMELKERSYPNIFYFSYEGYSKYGTDWMKVEDHYFSTK